MTDEYVITNMIKRQIVDIINVERDVGAMVPGLIARAAIDNDQVARFLINQNMVNGRNVGNSDLMFKARIWAREQVVGVAATRHKPLPIVTRRK